MAENTKKLCAQIPIELHSQVTEARTRLGQTTNEYITMLITEYFKMKTGVIIFKMGMLYIYKNKDGGSMVKVM